MTNSKTPSADNFRLARLSRRMALRNNDTERTEDDVRAERTVVRPCRLAPRFTAFAMRGEVVRVFASEESRA